MASCPYVSSCFCLLVCICISCIHPAVSSDSPTVAYHDHCSFIAPESIPTTVETDECPPSFHTSFLSGGQNILDRELRNVKFLGKSLRLEPSPKCYETESEGILKVEALLFIRYENLPDFFCEKSNSSYHQMNGEGEGREIFVAAGEMKFYMNGLWSKISKKLCMVGSTSWNSLKLDAVLKLNYPNDNPDMFTGITTGTFESIAKYNDPGYNPISIFGIEALPNYNYSLVDRELSGVSRDSVEVVENQNQSLISKPEDLCSVLSMRSTILELKYSEGCSRNTQHCFPISLQDGGLPRYVYLSPLQCSADKRNLRYLIRFQKRMDGMAFFLPEETLIKYLKRLYRMADFVPEEILIGEASWDEEINSLFIVACRVLNPADHSWTDAVGDCTMRLRLRYRSNLRIQNFDAVVGSLWSTKDVKDSGYFTTIELADTHQDDRITLPGMRYEYTMLDIARNLCPAQMSAEKGKTYPDAHSYRLSFSRSLKTDEEIHIGWISASASPVSVGNELYKIKYPFLAVDSVEPGASGIIEIPLPGTEIDSSPMNISYKISIKFYTVMSDKSINVEKQTEIIAEGVYNPETGHLCMVGCREVGSYGQTDCEIQVNVEFPPNEMTHGQIKGTISSTRPETDPLYFKDLTFMPKEQIFEEMPTASS